MKLISIANDSENKHALQYIERVLKADIHPADEIDLEKILLDY